MTLLRPFKSLLTQTEKQENSGSSAGVFTRKTRRGSFSRLQRRVFFFVFLLVLIPQE